MQSVIGAGKTAGVVSTEVGTCFSVSFAWDACDVGESEVEEESERASVRVSEEIGVRIWVRP